MHGTGTSNWQRLSQLRDGMDVFDAAGERVGRVQMFTMGDPEATTTAGNEARLRTPIERVAEAFGGEREPDVPEPLHSRLIRSGYIKIDGPDLLDTDRYVSMDHVRQVTADRVELDVRKDQLAIES